MLVTVYWTKTYGYVVDPKGESSTTFPLNGHSNKLLPDLLSLYLDFQPLSEKLLFANGD